MVTLDTSALIRFFTNDIPAKASKVRKILESNEKIRIPDVVFPELEYVLFGKTYNATRQRILKAFQFLVTRKNIEVSKSVIKGVELYAKTNLDIADCIIIAASYDNKLLSFDKKLISVGSKSI